MSLTLFLAGSPFELACTLALREEVEGRTLLLASMEEPAAEVHDWLRDHPGARDAAERAFDRVVSLNAAVAPSHPRRLSVDDARTLVTGVTALYVPTLAEAPATAFAQACPDAALHVVSIGHPGPAPRALRSRARQIVWPLRPSPERAALDAALTRLGAPVNATGRAVVLGGGTPVSTRLALEWAGRDGGVMLVPHPRDPDAMLIEIRRWWSATRGLPLDVGAESWLPRLVDADTVVAPSLDGWVLAPDGACVVTHGVREALASLPDEGHRRRVELTFGAAALPSVEHPAARFQPPEDLPNAVRMTRELVDVIEGRARRRDLRPIDPPRARAAGRRTLDALANRLFGRKRAQKLREDPVRFVEDARIPGAAALAAAVRRVVG